MSAVLVVCQKCKKLKNRPEYALRKSNACFRNNRIDETATEYVVDTICCSDIRCPINLRLMYLVPNVVYLHIQLCIYEYRRLFAKLI